MTDKDFYNLDYIIEINEKRIEEYISAYNRVLDRLTNIIFIYSGLTIFLFPIIQDIWEKEITHWVMIVAFGCFCIFFVVSIVYTVKLIIPVKVKGLDPPRLYYDTYRIQYEKIYRARPHISNLLKSSYIDELESVVIKYRGVSESKSHFHYKALIFALLSIIPYLICLAFHFSKRDDKYEKVQIVNSGIDIFLHKKDCMSIKVTETKSDEIILPKPGIKTNLPGVDKSQVIPVEILYVREDGYMTPKDRKRWNELHLK